MMHILKNIPILVTGGAGFIGSHLVEQLVHQEAQVTVLDNLSTGSLENLSSVIDKIIFIQGDIRDQNIVFTACKNQQIIFHLAAQISVPESINDPLFCHEVNVNGTLNILEACKEYHIEKLIFSSSAAVYGNHEGICSEDMHCHPTSPYGLSKLIGEHYLKLYFELYGIHSMALRYFNVFGERQSYDHPYAGVVAKFRRQMEQNLPITIFGDGSQTRDFVSVKDVVKANIMAAQLSKNQLVAQPINVASGKSISLLTLIQNLKNVEFPEYNNQILFQLSRSGDIKNSQADCSKLKNLKSNSP